MVPLVPVLALVAATLIAVAAGPAGAAGDRDALSDETIGLMIDDSGPGQAEALLGVLYLRGMRIESDPIAASAWLDRAARAGHPAGIYGAARMHADGIGVPVDTGRARQLLGNADPARFGPLADAVRRLRRDLGLPDAVAVTTPQPNHDTAKPAPVEPTPVAANVPPPPAAATEPVARAEPPVTALTVTAPPVFAPAITAEATSPAGTEPAGTGPAGMEPTQPARVEPARTEPAPPSPRAATAEPSPGAPPAEAAAPTPQPSPVAVESSPTTTPPPADAIAGPFAQLATLFSEASTASEMARIRGIVPPHLLQGRELSVRTVRLGDGRIAWRIVATGFAHRDDVRIFCGLVTASGLGCLPRQ